ncbi:MAG TPA: hypothetical protein VLL05_20920, partial [Terriglobales bacterium]|nr:hypothetical protein [Terriglobales bacterium]
DHISLTLDPVAVQAAIAAVESMDHEKPNQTMQPTAAHVYAVCPRKDKRGVDLISDALPFGRLWYDGPNAASNAIGYAQLDFRIGFEMMSIVGVRGPA